MRAGGKEVCPAKKDDIMKLMNEIPSGFWGLIRSPNRDIYIEALLRINEEYQYSSYFLSRELCIQVLGDHFSRGKLLIQREEQENDVEAQERRLPGS